MPFIYIVVFITVFSFLPAFISITKKAYEGKMMRRDIEQAGGKFFPTHKLWYLGAIQKSKCDFHVFYNGRILSVKVISLFSPKVFLNFINSTSYEIKELGKNASINNPNVVYSKKSKKPYDFRFAVPDEYNSLPHAKIILFNTPYPARITATRNGARVTLSVGNHTDEGAVYKRHTFVELFKKKPPKST